MTSQKTICPYSGRKQLSCDSTHYLSTVLAESPKRRWAVCDVTNPSIGSDDVDRRIE